MAGLMAATEMGTTMKRTGMTPLSIASTVIVTVVGSGPFCIGFRYHVQSVIAYVVMLAA